jgi:PAS domain S-box-containing protein
MASSRPLTIGFTRHFAVGVPFWTVAEHGARERARELDITLSVHHSATAFEQARVIELLVHQRLAAIIVAAIDPNDPAFVDALDIAAAAGIPVVAVDVPLPRPVACMVRSDDVQGAAVGASYLVERLEGHGKVVHLQGGMQSPVAQLRSQGVHQVLDRYSGIQIIIETDQGSWQSGPTRSLLHKVLAAHPDIRGVIAANDPMALGALDAITDVGRLGQVVVLGVDGDPDALLALQAGNLAATVQRSPFQMGRTAVEMAMQIIQGHGVPAEVLLNDMTLVTAETVAQAAFESLRIMPGVIDDLMESSMAQATERSLLRTIIDSLPDLIYVKDRDSRFEVANQPLARLMGVSNPEELIGKTDAELFPRELAVQYLADEQALMQSGEPLLNKEEMIVEPDGAQRWIVTTKVPLRDPQGQVFRLVGRGQDITERKIAEAERQRLQAELIGAQQAALQELSTPLIPISDRVLVMPLIGRIDTRRASQVLEILLQGIQTQGADLAIIDITGVNVVDTQVAHALIQAARAVKLLGAQVVLTGLRPEVAQTLVGLGVDLSGIVTRGTLQSGIAYALRPL